MRSTSDDQTARRDNNMDCVPRKILFCQAIVRIAPLETTSVVLQKSTISAQCGSNNGWD
jgi:hypothetical protein